MKLRNKNTGEIVEYDSVGFRKGLSDGWEDFVAKAKSLAELNEDWEDYELKNPVEPTKVQDTINWLRSENAYLRGVIAAYEKFLKDIGKMKEEENGRDN